MGVILDLAEAIWTGETNTYEHHPFGPPRGLEQLTDVTYFYKGFSNAVIRETDDGLIIVDPAANFDTQAKFDAIRARVQPRLNTAIYTHGHVDHTFGVELYVEEAQAKGWPRPKVIAHEAMLARFQRYRESVSWNATINLRQFRGGSGEAQFPDRFFPPDITYPDRMTINVGGVTALLRHARGETDDCTWVFFPDNRVLCTGDLFIWSIPNAGNPQKVQRYAGDWAHALREMAALSPEILAPGHGWPILGAERVRKALENTAACLDSIHEQTLALMNKGASLDTVIHSVKIPDELLEQPYLQPVYDEPEFIVRNVWRLYGGWYDGMPSHLKPASERAQAAEIARLAGGAKKLADRAEELLEAGDLRLACHLADWAYLASPEETKICETTRKVYMARVEVEPSTMAMGIYRSAAREMGAKVEGETPEGGVFRTQDRRGKKTPGT